MASRNVELHCTNCGSTEERDDLTVKRSIFFEFGTRGKQKRSRTVAWLCPRCTQEDPDWNREKNAAAPVFVQPTEEKATDANAS